MDSYTDVTSGTTFPLRQEFMWYQGADNTNNQQASGAYIFRPVTKDPISITNFVTLTFVNVSLKEVFDFFACLELFLRRS